MKKFSNLIFFFLFLALVLSLLAGCTQKPAEQKIEGNKNTDKKALALNLPEDLNSLDPLKLSTVWEIEIASLLYEGLVKYDLNTQTVVPALAEKWDVSAEGQQYTFTIRDKAFFHSEQKVTASDFKFSWERTIRSGSPEAIQIFSTIEGAEEFSKGKAVEVAGIKVINERTLQVSLTAADENFLLKITDPAASVVEQEAVNSPEIEYGKPGTIDQPTKITGTGPYSLVEWTPGQSIVLEAFPKYYQKMGLKRIEFQVEPESDIALAEMERGNIDILQTEEPLPKFLLDKDPALQELKKNEPRAEIVYLGFNVAKPPFNNSSLRQAISNALDRSQLAEQAGNFFAAKGLVPRVLLTGSGPTQPYKFDMEAAKRLYGYTLDETQKNPRLVLYYVNQGKNKQIAELVKKQLSQIGIDLRLQSLDSNQELDYGLKAGTINFYLNTWLARTPDPVNYLSTMFLSTSAANYSRYSNSAVDEQLNFAQTQKLTGRELKEVLLQAERIIMLEAPVVTILEAANYVVFSESILEPKLDPYKIIKLNEIAFKNPAEEK